MSWIMAQVLRLTQGACHAYVMDGCGYKSHCDAMMLAALCAVAASDLDDDIERS